jgi:hypothetical protein
MASSPARVVGDQAPVALPAGLSADLTTSLVADLGKGDATAMSSLVAALAAVPDVRRRRGAASRVDRGAGDRACACLTGAMSYVAIGEWVTAQGRAVLDCLDEEPCHRAFPCETTLCRCL